MTVAAARLHELPEEWLRALCASQPLAVRPDSAQAEHIDWKGIAADASAHAMGVLVYNRLRELGADGRLPEDVRRAWEADDRHARLQFLLQQRDAEEITAALTAAGVRHAFVKGSVYRQWLYRPSWVRTGADLELLIDRPSTEAARAAMFDLGFYHASATIDYRSFRPAARKQIAETEASHYELAQFVRQTELTNRPDWLLGPGFERRPPFTFERIGSGIQFHTVVDIHWTLHFMFKHESPLDEMPAPQPGALPRLSTPWNLVTTFFKLYFEAFDRPYYGFHHIADLAAMLQGGLSDDDWRRVDVLVQHYGLWAAAFYTLSAASAVAGPGSVPQELLESWARTAPPAKSLGHGVEKRTWHTALDLGDFIPFMIGYRTATRLGAPPAAPTSRRPFSRHREAPRPEARKEANA